MNSNKLKEKRTPQYEKMLKEKRRAELVKHQQNMRASQKREIPKFNKESANLLLEGKFHEEEDQADKDEDEDAPKERVE